MRRILFNEGWEFRKEHGDWHPVTLPHDAMQGEKRDPQAPSGNAGAYYHGGKYSYEKTFTLLEEEVSDIIRFQFDGVYRNARVFINDKQAGGAAYGYLPFFADATGLVHSGDNVIRVEVDNSEQPGSRWYSGSGIYRPVWMWKGNASYIEPWGIKVNTVSLEPAVIQVEVERSSGEVEIEIWDEDKLVVTGKGDKAELTIPNAKLWSDASPNLYRCHVILRESGNIVDEADQTFGIRTLRWDNKGFYVNDKRTLLQGGCIHHDNGILGACSYPEAEERRLRIMKQAGFNAIRCAHNPAGTLLLEACDRLGIYVMDEMWDMWYQRKNRFDYGCDFPANWKTDVETIVARDQSHPSVIMYSIGNELTEPHNEAGVIQAREISQLFKKLDSTRPTTIGLNLALVAMTAMGHGLYDNVDEPGAATPPATNSTEFNQAVSQNGMRLTMAACRNEVEALSRPVLAEVDIAGYNYATPRYPLEAECNPERVVVGSETFPHQLAATWKTMEQCPYVIGDFMWTAWDYLGECGIGAWSHTEDALEFLKPFPWKLADTGAFDILGDPNGEALWASAVWNGKTSIGVQPVCYAPEEVTKASWRGTNSLPSWSWKGCEGNPAVVEVYTPASYAELYLNDQLIERQSVNEMRAVFTVSYKPGKLETIVYDENNLECDRAELCSVQGEVKWSIACESDTLKQGQVAYFPISLCDESGKVERNNDAILEIEVEGGELLGFGSANPRTKAEFNEGRYPSYFGRALAAIRVSDDKSLKVTLKVDGIKTVKHIFNVEM